MRTPDKASPSTPSNQAAGPARHPSLHKHRKIDRATHPAASQSPHPAHSTHSLHIRQKSDNTPASARRASRHPHPEASLPDKYLPHSQKRAQPASGHAKRFHPAPLRDHAYILQNLSEVSAADNVSASAHA